MKNPRHPAIGIRKAIREERRARAKIYAKQSNNLDELKAKMLVMQEELTERDQLLGRQSRPATELPNFLNESLEDQMQLKEEIHREQSLKVVK